MNVRNARSLIVAICTAALFLLVLGRPAAALAQEASRQVNLHATAPDGVVLAGTLYTPGGIGPYVTVMLVHGSERGERRNMVYQRWATTLVAAGFACLVVDKRGVGESGGMYSEAPRFERAAGDVGAWVGVLMKQPPVRKNAIGLLGWSQAGWVAPLAASKTPEVAFLVLISGPGVSPLQQNIYDKTNQVLAQGLPEELATLTRRAVRAVLTYLVTGADSAGADAAWAAVGNQGWFTSTYTGVPFMDREALLADASGAEYVEHSQYDPAPALAALHIPVLALYGRSDRVVPVEESLVALRASLPADAAFTSRVFDGANHALGVTSDDGTTLLHPEVYPTIIDWIRAVTEPH